MVLLYPGHEDASVYLLCTKTGKGCVALDFSVTITGFHSMDNFKAIDIYLAHCFKNWDVQEQSTGFLCLIMCQKSDT